MIEVIAAAAILALVTAGSWLILRRGLRPLETMAAAQTESEAKLRQFLADASHELRTPLTSIQGFAELFRLGVANEHVDTDVIMRRIEEESKRMRVLVDDLLLLAPPRRAARHRTDAGRSRHLGGRCVHRCGRRCS
ncbi:MAG: histidine kinase dimerization/phospho-acceptor domain-containing protein [Ilumatobacteraceae bacterium]